LNDADFLFTVAEVSVALAGFAGLVSVVADRLGGRSGELGAHRLRTMLLYSLTATFFCLIPYICIRAGLAEIPSWRLCSAGLFIAWLLVFGRAFPRARRFSRGIPFLHLLLAYLGIALSVVGLAVLAANAAGAFGSHANVAYLVAIVLLLLAATRLFVRLFVSLIRPAV
jgi:hypothetical protein